MMKISELEILVVVLSPGISNTGQSYGRSGFGCGKSRGGAGRWPVLCRDILPGFGGKWFLLAVYAWQHGSLTPALLIAGIVVVLVAAVFRLQRRAMLPPGTPTPRKNDSGTTGASELLMP
jgi:hypothetical protein